MRLTLRTLLAYLDDTLDPAEIKQIGLKVAESDAAQELIARIKQVTRRRRLTTPPATGPGAKFDPNTIADYLDNLLPPDQVAEVEKTCLESDVHVAEIAACHQILTLVLGEPVLVPPTAKQRMYGLVHGREAQPQRRPPAVGKTDGIAADAHSDADDTLLLGLPLHHHQATWMRWALPIAAACLLFVLFLTIWSIVKPGGERSAASGDTGKETSSSAVASNTNDKETASKDGDKPKDGDQTKNGDKPKDDDQTKDGTKPKDGDKPKDGNANVQRPQPPSDAVREVGTYEKGRPGPLPSVLLVRSRDKDLWLRLHPDKAVSSGDLLLSPPGFISELRLATGVQLQLLGNLPEFMEMLPLCECAATLHATDKFDADLTLDRGRITLTNNKPGEPARCRVRFHDEVWDVTLEEPGSQVGLFLMGRHLTSFQSGLSPRADAGLCVLKGKVSVQIGHEQFSASPPNMFVWENDDKGTQPFAVRDIPPFWDKTVPDNETADAMRRSVKELQASWTGKATVESVLLNDLKSKEWSHRVLAVRCLGAIDDLPHLIDALGDEDPFHSDVRIEAIRTLIHWLGRNPGQDDKMYNVIKQTGILIDRGYTQGEANIIMQLLHPLSDEEKNDKETYDLLIRYLMYNKLPIRELATYHLLRLYPKGREFHYDPARGTDDRAKAVEKWQQLLRDDKLPPKFPKNPPAPGPGAGM
jgi:hypothetical protein